MSTPLPLLQILFMELVNLAVIFHLEWQVVLGGCLKGGGHPKLGKLSRVSVKLTLRWAQGKNVFFSLMLISWGLPFSQPHGKILTCKSVINWPTSFFSLLVWVLDWSTNFCIVVSNVLTQLTRVDRFCRRICGPSHVESDTLKKYVSYSDFP
jgi:hypothetical protein